MASRGSYPHPIIDNADDVDSHFEVLNIILDASQQDIEISYEIRTNDSDLKELIASGDAVHSLRWQCSSTISTGDMLPDTEQITGTGFKLRASIDQQDIKGNVTANVRVIAARKLEGIHWKKQHSDYGNSKFDVLPGDVLADGGFFNFSADKLYDPLNPPVGSCFRFVRSSTNRKGIKVTFDSDETVDVQIPAKTFDRFHDFANRPDLQISLVVLPALMETLLFIKNNREQEPLDDKVWFNTIDKLVHSKGSWELGVLELAQKILEHPIDNAISKGYLQEDDY